MKRFVLAALLACGLSLASVAGTALAQSYVKPAVGPSSGSTVSPYLNLLQGGNPAISYYGIVKPQQETQTFIQQLQRQGETSQQNIRTTDPATGVPTTGHVTRFGNYGQYFNGGTPPNLFSKPVTPTLAGQGNNHR